MSVYRRKGGKFKGDRQKKRVEAIKGGAPLAGLHYVLKSPVEKGIGGVDKPKTEAVGVV